MTLFDLNDDGSGLESSPDYVRVLKSHIGNGVYAVRPYPANSVIGQIKGKLIGDPMHETEYTFEADEGMLLEPIAPFRFINHSCNPNCEFEWLGMEGLGENLETDADCPRAPAGLYLSALKNIEADEQLTIDYNWPASSAIRCHCNQADCRGWVVAIEEVDSVNQRNGL